MKEETAASVYVQDEKVLIQMGDKIIKLPLKPLSGGLYEWFIEGRRRGIENLKQGKGPGPLFSRHLPVVATTADEDLFSTRLANKGVGFLPRPHLLEQTINEYEETMARTGRMTPEQSLHERLEAAAGFLEREGAADPRLLGSLEIFAGGTYENIVKRPYASLLFTDPGPAYRSFQLDCAVQILHPPDPRFRFLQLARGLFERDPFHVTQPGVHCAYLFWIVGIHDKTPFSMDKNSVRHRH
ncbi:MAG: hypothetical protein PVJ01_02720 [Pseudomonadota bacterium]|jgi:hypothetical protein